MLTRTLDIIGVLSHLLKPSGFSNRQACTVAFNPDCSGMIRGCDICRSLATSEFNRFPVQNCAEDYGLKLNPFKLITLLPK